MGNKAVFLDRDGTMAPDVHYCSRPEDFELFPNTARAIKMLNEQGFKVIVITNQSGIARGYFTEDMLTAIHEKMKRELAKEGARVDGIYHCPHHPDDNCNCRKPKHGLILQAAHDFNIDLERSIVVGDLQTDIALGKAVGCKTIMVGTAAHVEYKSTIEPDAIISDIVEMAQIVVGWDSRD